MINIWICRFALTVITLGVIAALSVNLDRAHSPSLTGIVAASPPEALLLTANVDQVFVSQNETIQLKVSLRNNTKKTVYVTESNPLADYKIEVRNQDGTLAPPTKEGQKQLSFSLWSTRRLSVAIEPGQEMNQAFEINKIYAMPTGMYKITVRRKVTTEFCKQTVELTSNVVRVRVTD